MKKMIYMAALAMAAVVACQKNEMPDGDARPVRTLTVGMSDAPQPESARTSDTPTSAAAGTRVGFDENNSCYCPFPTSIRTAWVISTPGS